MDPSDTEPAMRRRVLPLEQLTGLELAEAHLFRVGDSELLLNVETLLTYEVDEKTSQALRALRSGNGGGVGELVARYGRAAVEEVLGALREGQFLVPRGEKPHSDLPETVDERTTITNVNFNVNHACNLACRYCYGAEGNHPARTEGPARLLRMNEDVARRSIAWALRETEGAADEFYFGCFGGEPLTNFELIKKVQTWLDEAGARFGRKLKLSFFTNGVLLKDEVLDFIVEHDISVIVSIDGPAEVHDRNRPHADGRGSYAEVARNVQELLKRRPAPPTARGTYARWNMLDGFRYVDIVEHLLGLGFGNVWIDSISEPGGAGAFTTEDIPRLRALYEETAERILRWAEQGRRFDFSNVTRYVAPTRLVEDKKVAWGCGAGRGFACLTPDGGLYVCHRFTGMDDWRLGDVFGGVSKRLTREIIAGQNVRVMNGCRSCWMRYFCGGGCMKIHLEGTGDPFSAAEDVYCAARRMEVEMGLYVNSRLKGMSEQAQRTLYGEQLMSRLSAADKQRDPCRWF